MTGRWNGNAIKYNNLNNTNQMAHTNQMALNHENSYPYHIPFPLPGTRLWKPEEQCPIKKFWNPGTVASLF